MYFFIALILSLTTVIQTTVMHMQKLPIKIPKQSNLIQPRLSKTIITNQVNSITNLPLNISLEFVVFTFEDKYDDVNIFFGNITFSDRSVLQLNCKYSGQNKMSLSSTFIKNDKKEIKKLEQTVEEGKWNRIIFNFNYENIVIPQGYIKTIFYRSQNPQFSGIITDITVKAQETDRTILVISGKQSSQWVAGVDPISHPISMKGLVLPSNLISNKIPHQIPILKQGRKMLVCHDMMNGYKQQMSQYSNTFSSHAYRFNHWKITDIFVYFSHENIAIPPKHYRQICRKQKVACLATFIIEAPINWLREQIADYLIFLAIQHQFDGYLVNIQYSVSSSEQFKKWLNHLTQNMHKKLPNSIVVLYDSIVESGGISYQSGISNSNIDFFNKVDYFFTDYHWNQNVLQSTAKMTETIKRSSDVFMGNDVYGRGTWGGGKFDTVVGVKQINKYNLSTAIFAPGYVYEAEGGKINYEKFQEADDQLWFGKSSIKKQIMFGQWSYQTQEWKQQGTQSKSTINSSRSIQIDIPMNILINQISFTNDVKGDETSRNQVDIILLILDTNKNIIKQKSLNKKSNSLINYSQMKVKVHLNSQQRLNAKRIKIIEHNKGNNLIKFKNQKVYFKYFKNEQSISQYFEERPQKLPYHSYMNIAVGPNYYFEGQKIIENGYNFLADYDLPYQNKKLFSRDSFNDQFKSNFVDVSYDQSFGWVGAGSLKILCNQSQFGLRLLKLDQKLKNINVRFVIKTSSQIIPLLGIKYANGQNEIFQLKSVDVGQWITLQISLNFQTQKHLKSVYLLHQSNKIQEVTILIGQIAMFVEPLIIMPSRMPEIIGLKCLNKKSCINLFIDIKDFPMHTKTIFIEINNIVIGTIYQKTGYIKEISLNSFEFTVKLLGLSLDGTLSLIYDKDIKIKQ